MGNKTYSPSLLSEPDVRKGSTVDDLKLASPAPTYQYPQEQSPPVLLVPEDDVEGRPGAPKRPGLPPRPLSGFSALLGEWPPSWSPRRK